MPIRSLSNGSGGFRPAASNSPPSTSPAPKGSMQDFKAMVEEIRRQGVKPGKEPKSILTVSRELAEKYNRQVAGEKKLPNNALYDCTRERNNASDILINALDTVHHEIAQKYSLTTKEWPTNQRPRRPATNRLSSPTRVVEDYRRESKATYRDIAKKISAWIEDKKQGDPGFIFKSALTKESNFHSRQCRLTDYTENDVIALREVLPKEFGERVRALTHDQAMVAWKGTARLPLHEFHPEGLEKSFENFLKNEPISIPKAASQLGYSQARDLSRKLEFFEGRHLTNKDREKILETYPDFKPTYVALVEKSYDEFFPQAPEHKPDFFTPSMRSATAASSPSLDASTTPPPKKPRLGSGSPNTITSIDSPPDLFAPANPTPMAFPARGFFPDQNPFPQSVAPPAGMHPHPGGSAFDPTFNHPTFNPFPVVFGSTVSGYPAAANPYPARPTTPSDSGLETLWPPAPAQAPADTQNSPSLKRKPDDDYEAWKLFIHFPPKIPKP